MSVHVLVVVLGLELPGQSHAVRDEYQIGKQGREGFIVRGFGGGLFLRLGLILFPGLGYTQWRMFTVSGATTALGGIISRRRTIHRSTRKVSILEGSVSAKLLTRSSGKYMLEREKLIKENSWQVDES